MTYILLLATLTLAYLLYCDWRGVQCHCGGKGEYNDGWDRYYCKECHKRI
jgi:hypothetical protein